MSLPSAYCTRKVKQWSQEAQELHSVPGDVSDNSDWQVVTSRVGGLWERGAPLSLHELQRVPPSAEVQPCCPSGHAGPVSIPSRPAPFPVGIPRFRRIPTPLVLCSVAQSRLTLRARDRSPLGPSGPEDSPGKNIRVGCHALLQGIFPTQGSNTGLLHCRQVLYRLSHQESPTDPWGVHKMY